MQDWEGYVKKCRFYAGLKKLSPEVLVYVGLKGLCPEMLTLCWTERVMSVGADFMPD